MASIQEPRGPDAQLKDDQRGKGAGKDQQDLVFLRCGGHQDVLLPVMDVLDGDESNVVEVEAFVNESS